jgi:DNA polymerase III epsilon subunit-like protein
VYRDVQKERCENNMILLGADTETTGLDASRDRITEIGLCLYDTDTKQPVRISGFLVKPGIPIPAELEKLTGITNAMVDAHGVEPKDAVRAISGMAAKASFFVAHNAEFDKGMIEAEYKRQGLTMPALPFIDTRVDLPSAAYSLGKSASLRYLAADHSFVYPAHRAVSDVLAMLEILSRYDIDETIRRAQTPNVKVRAVVSFDERHLAKERSYYWDSEKKVWWKPLKADEVDAEKEAAPFSVVVMGAN